MVLISLHPQLCGAWVIPIPARHADNDLNTVDPKKKEECIIRYIDKTLPYWPAARWKLMT